MITPWGRQTYPFARTHTRTHVCGCNTVCNTGLYTDSRVGYFSIHCVCYSLMLPTFES